VRWSQKMGSLTDKVPDSNGFKRSPKLQK